MIGMNTHELRAEHAFTVFGLPFLVLHYRIRPKGENDLQGRRQEPDRGVQR